MEKHINWIIVHKIYPPSEPKSAVVYRIEEEVKEL